jgi:DNA-binding transcriptional LysR family regulator
MEIRQLRLFVAVAEELHFARAAARELVAPSQVSARIRALERELGTRLFDRSTRQVRLTPAGAELLAHARHILAELDLAREHALRAAAAGARQLRVGWPAVGEPALIARVMTGYVGAHPELQLAWRVGHSAPMARAVAAGELDTAFVYQPQEPHQRLGFLPLYRRPVKVACAAQHPLAVAPEVTVELLRAVPHVAFAREENPPLYGLLYDQLLDGAPHVVEHATSVQAVLGIVATGTGVALRVEGELPERDGLAVVYRELADPVPQVDLGLVWRRCDGGTPLVDSLLTYAAAVARLPTESETMRRS